MKKIGGDPIHILQIVQWIFDKLRGEA